MFGHVVDTQMSETLASGQQLFPCCGGVYGNHQVRISLVYSSLLGSAEDWGKRISLLGNQGQAAKT